MIKKFEITGVHADTDEKLQKYITKSVAKLERYIPRHARESVHIEVKLKESKSQNSQRCSAELIMFLPHGQLTAKEATVNMFAAVDIAEAKLINQLKKYKETHGTAKLRRRLVNRLRRREA
jgi:ribosomal subunit interface protein